jgi:DNA-binding MarR family transcriptional regulator/GNAT superfamily N-acetyltransferase
MENRLKQPPPDIFEQLGPLALGSRLRRLSDRLMADGGRIYSAQNLSFEPSWFPLFYLLSTTDGISVGDAAEALGVTQPAVTSTYKDLVRRGLVSVEIDPSDQRRRLLTLSEEGQSMLPRLRALWKNIDQAINGLLSDIEQDFMADIDRIERAVEQRSFFARIEDELQESEKSSVHMRDYTATDKQVFVELNVEWVEKYFKMEEADRKALADPENYIIKPGGRIFFAELDGEVIGTCSLIAQGNGVYELAKMAVTESAQGHGIGNIQLQHVVDEARAMGAKRLVLETNSGLAPALHLYEKFGFHPLPDGPSGTYERGDVALYLDL